MLLSLCGRGKPETKETDSNAQWQIFMEGVTTSTEKFLDKKNLNRSRLWKKGLEANVQM